jgi:hypothetical protein
LPFAALFFVRVTVRNKADLYLRVYTKSFRVGFPASYFLPPFSRADWPVGAFGFQRTQAGIAETRVRASADLLARLGALQRKKGQRFLLRAALSVVI